METGASRKTCSLVLLLVQLALWPACAATQPTEDAVDPHRKSVPLAQQAVDLLNPRGWVTLPEVRQAYADASAALAALQAKVEQIDIGSLNQTIAGLAASLEALRVKTDGADVESLGQVADKWRESAEKLTATLETLEKKIGEIQTERFNDALQQASAVAESWDASGSDLQALLSDVAKLLEAVDPQQISAAIEQAQRGSKHFELASANLSSTSTSLSTTIWLLNALLGVGITLGVIHIVRLRRTDRQP